MRGMKRMIAGLVLMMCATGALAQSKPDGYSGRISELVIDLSPIPDKCKPPAFTGERIDIVDKEQCGIKIVVKVGKFLQGMALCHQEAIPMSSCQLMAVELKSLSPVYDALISNLFRDDPDAVSRMVLGDSLESLDPYLSWEGESPSMLQNYTEGVSQ